MAKISFVQKTEMAHGLSEREIALKANTVRAAFDLEEPPKGLNEAATFSIRDTVQEIAEHAAARPTDDGLDVWESIDRGPLFAGALDKPSSSYLLNQLSF
jgi:hypothetical protein